MNIKLKPIAESKVRQLGGDVCGVLVRKGDKVATVTDMGRVKWLSNSVLWPIANECTSEREAFEDAMAGEAHLKWIPEVGEYSSQITQKMWQTWRCARAGDDPDLQLIKQRDHWEEKATELAEAVGEHFSFQVGEHSSANCPVQNAIDRVDELGGARAQGGQNTDQISATLEHTEPEPVGFIPSSGLNNLNAGHPAKIYPMAATPSPFESHSLVYTQPHSKGGEQ